MSDTVYEKDGRRIASAIDALLAGGTSSGAVWDWSRSLVDVDLHRREVYSYGRHFPLFRYVPRRVSGRRDLFVINGDESPRSGRGWGGSRTPDHQSDSRRLIGETRADSLVIPFSALAGAGIDLDSVRPVHVRPDANWTDTLYADRLEDVPFHERRVWDRALNDTRDRAPDDDGRYSWTVSRHRLGDCLFSAVREESFMRPARPFEVSSDSARERVEVAPRDSYCSVNESRGHEAGPSGVCVHCTRPLQTRVTRRRRARYLSSFDYQERAPLYFLVQVPRGAGATVEEAIDSLAPRAVHAARARGIQVERQGDIFFVRTRLSDIDLELRGIAARARLTQWDRDARARKGETGYVRPLSADGRRTMHACARAEFKRIFGKALLDVTCDERSHADMLARRIARREEVSTDAPERRRTRNTVGAYRETGPKSEPGARKRWARARAQHAIELERARADLRRVTLGNIGPASRYSASRYSALNRYDRFSPLQRERFAIVEQVKRARERLEELESRTLLIVHGRAAARDRYRRPFNRGQSSDVARIAWRMARTAAHVRFIPHEHDGGAIAERRASVRDVLAIYGTAHTAREVVRTRGGAVYVKGRVSHRPLLDPAGGRDAAPDHAPLELAPDAWYLAVRNRVPRAKGRA